MKKHKLIINAEGKLEVLEAMNEILNIRLDFSEWEDFKKHLAEELEKVRNE